MNAVSRTSLLIGVAALVGCQDRRDTRIDPAALVA